MTTTPAPNGLDLDALKALEQAATPGPWTREWAFNTHFVVPEAAKSVAADNVSRLKPNQRADAELIAAMRNALPALLDELAKTRTHLAVEEQSHGETIDDRDACHEAADKLAEAIAAAAGVDIGEHSNMNDPWANALDAMPKLVAELAEARREIHTLTHSEDGRAVFLEQERDAAREELAKTRAELDALKTDLRISRSRCASAERIMAEDSRKLTEVRAELGNAKARISAAATVQVWTNEDGERFVFANDLMDALDPNPEANPATTAEPAACTCATWREETPYGLQTITGPDATCPTHGELTMAEPADEPKAELCSDKNGFHDGHDWTPDPCEPYRWCPGYPVPRQPNRTCGHKYVGNEGEFTCDLYDPHPGKHWNSLAEFAWTAEPAAS